MKVIILGASGQIGSHLYRHLISKTSWEITGTSRKGGNGLLPFDPFSDKWPVLGKADVLINCIGMIRESAGMNFEKIHFGITSKIIEHRAVLGDPRIIQLSALGASSTHPVAFLRTKGEADDFLAAFPDTTAVRPSIVCTSGTMLVRKMRMLGWLARFTRGRILVPEGFEARVIQPVMMDDLATVVEKLCVAASVTQVLEVAGPDKVTLGSLLELLFEVKRKDYKVLTVSEYLIHLLVKYVVSVCFPSVVTRQQYALLSYDNISASREAEKLLGRPLAPTASFWRDEFEK